MNATPRDTAARWRLLRDPGHCLSLGFGAGLSPAIPGTVGSLWAFPLHAMLHTRSVWIEVGIVVFLAALGVWLCGRTASALGTSDPACIVWDEIIGCLIVFTWLGQAGWPELLTGFLLFRLFDIAKPWPISQLDRRITGGVGIMLDDILAAGAAIGCLYAGARIGERLAG